MMKKRMSPLKQKMLLSGSFLYTRNHYYSYITTSTTLRSLLPGSFSVKRGANRGTSVRSRRPLFQYLQSILQQSSNILYQAPICSKIFYGNCGNTTTSFSDVIGIVRIFANIETVQKSIIGFADFCRKNTISGEKRMRISLSLAQ